MRSRCGPRKLCRVRVWDRMRVRVRLSAWNLLHAYGGSAIITMLLADCNVQWIIKKLPGLLWLPELNKNSCGACGAIGFPGNICHAGQSSVCIVFQSVGENKVRTGRRSASADCKCAPCGC